MARKTKSPVYQRKLYKTHDADAPEDILGPLKHLPGKWVGEGTGWNMIALPFQEAPPPPQGFNYRVLMNQYREDLTFSLIDSAVPNRGLRRPGNPASNFDQEVVTLDYQQQIKQIAVDDRPPSSHRGPIGAPIHHEPGLWLYARDLRTDNIDIARLASIPHGNSVLALGESSIIKGAPVIPPINGFPIGRHETIENLPPDAYDFRSDPYLAPYKHYVDTPFMGTVTGVPGFPGFSPNNMNAILSFANQGVDIKRTTVLTVDSKRATGGVSNMPFTTREAEPVSMRSTFWIQELAGKKIKGKPRLRMQYSQVVMLNFFGREDQLPGRATWPHISIATLEKVY
ncbi:MAG: heme-binding protein [Albidovulum sp.]|uniref:heme-binding protein n=1 Tax=Albidovulum sp. TaxID=1872424 RepID=UPI003CB4BAB6